MKDRLITIALIIFLLTIASFFWLIWNVYCQIFYNETINGISIACFVVFGLFFFRMIFSIGDLDDESEDSYDEFE